MGRQKYRLLLLLLLSLLLNDMSSMTLRRSVDISAHWTATHARTTQKTVIQSITTDNKMIFPVENIVVYCQRHCIILISILHRSKDYSIEKEIIGLCELYVNKAFHSHCPYRESALSHSACVCECVRACVNGCVCVCVNMYCWRWSKYLYWYRLGTKYVM